MSEQEIDALERDVTGKTLGALLRDVRKLVEIEEDGAKLLQEALQLRNQLCHGFFHRMASDHLTNSGRRRICAELLRVREKMKQAELLSQVICKMLLTIRGINEEDLQAELERDVIAARARDGEL